MTHQAENTDPGGWSPELIRGWIAEVAGIRRELVAINEHLARLNGTVDKLENSREDHEKRLSLMEYITRAHGLNWDRVVTILLAGVQALLITVLLARLA